MLYKPIKQVKKPLEIRLELSQKTARVSLKNLSNCGCAQTRNPQNLRLNAQDNSRGFLFSRAKNFYILIGFKAGNRIEDYFGFEKIKYFLAKTLQWVQEGCG